MYDIKRKKLYIQFNCTWLLQNLWEPVSVFTHACMYIIYVYMWRRINAYWSPTIAWNSLYCRLDRLQKSCVICLWPTFIIPASAFHTSLPLYHTHSLHLTVLPCIRLLLSPSIYLVSFLWSCLMIRPGDHNTDSLCLTFLLFSTLGEQAWCCARFRDVVTCTLQQTELS